MEIGSIFIGAGGGAVLGLIAHILYAKAKGSSASVEAERIRQDAEREAKHMIRDSKVQAKSESMKLRDEAMKEVKEQRKELGKVEKRLTQREDNLEKKGETLDKRLESVSKKESDLDQKRQKVTEKEDELRGTISKQIDELERVAHLSRDEARDQILSKMEVEVRNEAGNMARNIIDEAKSKAEKKANEVIVGAIQRYASECVYERTSATIPLPSDEMKGRIIGREGRNIRALEASTGVSILIDDTPEAVVITCFDPVRKEVARVMLERLVQDGRIHPTRIEELKKKVEKEIEEKIFEAGEAAVLECGIKQNLPKQVIELVGRLQFRYSYSQNVLKHSIECAFFMGAIAVELGLDEQKARLIGLLHDIGKAVDHEIEGTHARIGGDILRKYGIDKEVINAVEGHHEEVDSISVYTPLAAATDAISASRPGARSETTELYLKRLEKLEEIAVSFDGVEKCFALQAGRELRVVIEPHKIKEGDAVMLAKEICERIEKEMNYPGQIKVSIIRETRSVAYAK